MCARRRYRRESRACDASSGATPFRGERPTCLHGRAGGRDRRAGGEATGPGRKPWPRSGTCARRRSRRPSAASTCTSSSGATRPTRRLHRRDERLAADRVRLRARPELRAADGGVPLDRDRGHFDRAEPALGWGRLRAPRARLPPRNRERAARLPAIDAIEAWVPLFLFSVLFGLSMDYQVFLLSRIKERYDQTGSTTDAVVHGVSSTARLITGAALIIVAVFAGFAMGDLVMFQQMGFGIAVALSSTPPSSARCSCPRRCACSVTGTGTCRAGWSGCRGSRSRLGAETSTCHCRARAAEPASLADARASGRHRHVSLHRHRGLDGAVARARGFGVRGVARRASAALREAFAAHGGVEVDTQGDAFFVAFPTREEAVAAARDAQEELTTGPVRVRMGLHTGEPLLTREGYVGVDVHRAARICCGRPRRPGARLGADELAVGRRRPAAARLHRLEGPDGSGAALPAGRWGVPAAQVAEPVEPALAADAVRRTGKGVGRGAASCCGTETGGC